MIVLIASAHKYRSYSGDNVFTSGVFFAREKCSRENGKYNKKVSYLTDISVEHQTPIWVFGSTHFVFLENILNEIYLLNCKVIVSSETKFAISVYRFKIMLGLQSGAFLILLKPFHYGNTMIGYSFI